ncbi:MAG: dihydroneopterin aldolase [Bacteroidota bacterium]
MGKISLEGMEFFSHHGYYDDEQERGNKFVVDLYIETDFAGAAKTDELSKTISYEEVYGIVKEQMAIRSKLLENAAQRIVDALKLRYPEIISIELKLSKLNPLLKGMVQKVGVTIKV